MFYFFNFRAKRGSSLFEGGSRGSERKRATERELRPSEARETITTTERSEGDVPHQPPPPRPSAKREGGSVRSTQCIEGSPRFVGFCWPIGPKNWNILMKLGQNVDFTKPHRISWFIFWFSLAFKGYEGFKGQIDFKSQKIEKIRALYYNKYPPIILKNLG